MSLKKELQQLQQQKRQELATLHYTYLRTKRDFKRKISPDRFVRKHLGATMAAAAVATFILAPRPGPSSKVVREALEGNKPKDSIFRHITGLIRNILGQFERPAPPPTHHTDSDGAKSASTAKTSAHADNFLQAIIAILASKLDVTHLLLEVFKHFRGAGRDDSHKGNGHSPDVAIADVGTVKPDQFDDFE
jgi:hypothetical protein